MNNLYFLWIIALAIFVSVCGESVKTEGIFVDFTKIEPVKKQIKKGDIKYLPAYQNLIEKAELAIQEGSFSVTTKKRTPPMVINTTI